jgi:predicted metalloendopeptidase
MRRGVSLRVFLAVCSVTMFGWPGLLAAQEATPMASPAASVDATIHGALRPNMDLSVDPRRDFYDYANGGWLSRAEIPPDEAYYGITQELQDRTRTELIGLLDRLATSDEIPVGSDEWKAVQLYAQAKDIKTRNAQGIAPIEPELEAIDAIASLDDLYAFVQKAFLTSYAYGFYGISGNPDLADSSVYAAWYSGPSLGLPNRDYYWEDSPENEATRVAYRTMNAALLGYTGYGEDQAQDAAERVYEFEKRLAEPTLGPEDFNDPQNYYHPRPVSDLEAANPRFDWPAFLKSIGQPDLKTVVVTEEKYLDSIDDILESTDLETIKDYLKVQVLQGTASELSEEMGKTAFDFYGTFLNGVEEQRPIDERALGDVNGSLGFAVGKLYVDEYFPPEAKAAIEDLVQHLIAATGTRIQNLSWMSAETKETALAKLDAMGVKVGYPDKWQTYEAVNIEESLAATMLSASLAEADRDLARIGKPVDRSEWAMLPQEINAYYDPTNNEIVFPAGILQAPFYDYQADLAYNYGDIGATIGHEITHAFDQSGSQFDAEGNLSNWWTDEDRARFEALTARVATQYSAIEVLPGVFVNGDLTIGENIADMGGLQIAYDALHQALKESGDPSLIEGLTPDERFFVSFAFSWVEKARPEAIETQVATNRHAPNSVRAVQPSRNMDVFFTTFGIEPGDPMYLPPEERVVIW